MRTMHTAPSFSVSPPLGGGSGHCACHHSTPATRRAIGKPGFSFAEVMFAVVILGIGFILVAAIFPVAIQQTQSTSEESSASIMAREASNAVKALPGTIANPLYNSAYTYNPIAPNAASDYQSVQTELVMPPTVKNYVMGTANIPSGAGTPSAVAAAPPAVVVPFVGPRWDQLRGSIIPPSDPRYSYVAFYRRESGAQSAQLIVVPVANRQRPIYTSMEDAQPAPLQVTYNVDISTTPAQFPAGPTGASVLTLIAPDTVNILKAQVEAQEGWYLTTPPPGYTSTPAPLAVGRSYRLGRPLTGVDYAAGVYEMEPGDDMLLTSGMNGIGWGSAGIWSSSMTPPPSPDPVKWIYGGIRDASLSSQQANIYPYATLQAVIGYAQLSTSSAYPNGVIRLYLGSGLNAPTDNLAPPNAIAGAYVIVADDYPFDPSFPGYSAAAPSSANYYLPPNLSLYNTNTPPTLVQSYKVGSMNGRIFRLGQPVLNDPQTAAALVGTYQLDPAYAMRPPDPNGPSTYSPDTFPNPDFVTYESTVGGSNPHPIANPQNLRAKVFIVGMGVENLQRVTGGAAIGGVRYSNTSQGIGAFSTYIPVQ